MPQLNPTPWLMILGFTWTILLILLIPKIQGFKFLQDPILPTSSLNKFYWHWPWT